MIFKRIPTRISRPKVSLLAMVALMLIAGPLWGDEDKGKDKNKDKDRKELPAKTDQGKIEGVYEGPGVKLSVQWVNQTPRGEYTRGGKTFKFVGKSVGKKIGESIAGTLLNGDIKIDFTAKMEGDALAFAAGFDTLKLKRVTDTVPTVQGNVKKYETILATSMQAIESTVRVSPDNTKVAFAAGRKDRLAMRLWINGKAMESDYDGSGLRFSDDSGRLAYRLIKNSKSYFVVDDQLQGPYDEILVHPDVFSSDGNRTIYAARAGKQWRVVVEGKAGPPFDEISRSFGFSPDGQRWGYIGRRGRNWHAVVDGQISPPYEAIVSRKIVFGPNGQRVFYAIGRSGRQVPILDGKELGTYDAVANVKFSNDGKRFAYVVLNGNSRVVIVDGKQIGSYAHVGELRFSPDGKKLAFPARVDGAWKLIVDGEPQGDDYTQVSLPVFSGNGESLLFLAEVKGKQHVVRDGMPSEGYDQVDGARFSPDGKRMAFLAKQGKQWVVVVGGKSSYPYNVKPSFVKFSPDSKHYVHSAKRDGSTYLVVDGTEGKAVWPMLRGSDIVFDEAKRFHTVVRRNDEFIRLDVEILK